MPLQAKIFVTVALSVAMRERAAATTPHSAGQFQDPDNSQSISCLQESLYPARYRAACLRCMLQRYRMPASPCIGKMQWPGCPCWALSAGMGMHMAGL